MFECSLTGESVASQNSSISSIDVDRTGQINLNPAKKCRWALPGWFVRVLASDSESTRCSCSWACRAVSRKGALILLSTANFLDSFRTSMEKGADQVNLKRAPLYGKLHYTTTKQEPLCLSLSPACHGCAEPRPITTHSSFLLTTAAVAIIAILNRDDKARGVYGRSELRSVRLISSAREVSGSSAAASRLLAVVAQKQPPLGYTSCRINVSPSIQ
jgi:hypothetical protein